MKTMGVMEPRKSRDRDVNFSAYKPDKGDLRGRRKDRVFRKLTRRRLRNGNKVDHNNIND